MITSSSNAQMKYLIKLQEKGAMRKADGVYVCEGKKMFDEVLRYAADSIVKAYFSECFQEEAIACFGDLLKEKEIAYDTVSDSVFKDVSQTVTPQGVLAVVKQPCYSLEGILSGEYRKEKSKAKESLRLLLLEDLRDPGNLGTIIRTAEGAGMDGVILSAASVDMFNPKVIRATMGAIYRVPFLYVKEFTEMIKQLQEDDVRIFAAHLEGSVEYDTVAYPEKAAIMVGNEANGLTDEASRIADMRIRIPMEGAVESLNAGVAAAILMYEMYRQTR